jgi:hypothetical protein
LGQQKAGIEWLLFQDHYWEYKWEQSPILANKKQEDSALFMITGEGDSKEKSIKVGEVLKGPVWRRVN